MRHKKRSGLEDDRTDARTPVLPVAALVAAVIVIIGLALFNLYRGGERNGEIGKDAATPQSVPSAHTVPSFDVVRISRGGTGVLAGRAAPDALVELMIGEQVFGDARSDRNGEWVMILEEPLAPGTVEMTLRAGRDGEQPLVSRDVVVVSIPEPMVPDRFAEREGEGVVAVLTPREGDGPSRVLQKPGLATPGELGDSLAVDTLDYGANGATIVSGRGVARSMVRLYLDNRFVGETRAGDDGAWRIEAASPIPDGRHELRVDQIVGNGEVALRILQPFDGANGLDPSLAQSGVVVQPGNTLWAIARQLYGRGTRFTLIFQENSEQILDPNLIYPGQLFKLPDAPKTEGEPQGG